VTFAEDELEFPRSSGIARPATLGAADQPDVVPVAVEFHGSCLGSS
jgi:pyridoxamine 5'-phosphate oxidase family protein